LGQKFIIVDDDEDICEMLKLMFESLDHSVELFLNASDAFKFIKKQVKDCIFDYDAVLTDIFMPEIDGITLTTQIRQILPNLPVVIVSAGGHQNTDAFREAEKAGADFLLEKPFTMESVERIITKIAEKTTAA